MFVDYAHTPGALETALEAARELGRGGRVICVFGAGGDRDRAKRPLMGQVVSELADLSIVTSDNPRSEDPAAIAAEVVDGLDLEVELDRRRAIERALELARPGDVVVIAGKGHEQGQESRRPHASVRRPPGGTRGVAPPGGADVIALETSVLDGLGDSRCARGQVHRRTSRLAAYRLRRSLRCGRPRLGVRGRCGRARRSRHARADDAFAALAHIARAVRERSSARVVGITGSMGKTSTKDILAALSAPSARTIAAEASYNNEIGVPLTLCRLETDTEVCVLELAMRGFGQIAELAAIARPQIGVVTNVGPVHLELVDSLDGVTQAKGELIEALPAGGTAIVPEDFPVSRDDVEVIRVGTPEGIRVDGRTSVGGVSFNFIAQHQVQNAATALAALTRSACRGRSPSTWTSPAGAERSRSSPVAVSSSTTPTTQTRSPCAPAWPIWPSAPGTDGAWRSSATWPSSAHGA